MKQYLAFFLIVLLFFLIGCGSQDQDSGTQTNGEENTVTVAKSNIPPSNEDESEFDDLDSALDDIENLENLE